MIIRIKSPKPYLSNLFVLFFVILLTIFSTTQTAIAAEVLNTQGITYNSDSSANISRPSDLVWLQPNPISQIQGWVAIRVKIGFPSNTNLSPDPVMWDMSESDPKSLFLYYDVDTDQFRMARAGVARSVTQSFTTGTFKTIIGTWDSSSVKISVDGSPFVTASAKSDVISSPAPFYIGSTVQQGSGRQTNSDYYWVASGTGKLTDADAALIHSFGNQDKKRSDFPGNAIFIWWANSNVYNNDNSSPTISPSNTPTQTPVTGDANGDRKVDGIDFSIWLNHYNTNTNNGVKDGDFNKSGKVDGVDFSIWLNNYGTVG